MAQRTEQEIMRNWKYAAPPLVSVCSITYNHEPYIRDALDGFLMQETDFPFEVIIHDDASTDRTAEIIREYAAQYPNIIKPIFQTENQYSKGVKISTTYVWPKAQGEYIALCEGDDYWTDPRKLQIQIEEMRKHPECDLSFHPAKLLSYNSKSSQTMIGFFTTEHSKILSLRDILERPGMQFATSAIIINKSLLTSYSLYWFFQEAPYGDFFLKVFGSIRGGALYINLNMSTYRRGTLGSWTDRMQIYSYYTFVHNKHIYCLEKLKKILDASFNQTIDKIISRSYFTLAMRLLYDNKTALFKKNIAISYYTYPNLNLKRNILYRFSAFPSLLKFIYDTYKHLIMIFDADK